jgi:hypothetical protein
MGSGWLNSSDIVVPQIAAFIEIGVIRPEAD